MNIDKPMLIHGDCLEKMRELAANSIDAIVTDPPYGLAFMGKDWDFGVPGIVLWKEALRVAKPGAHLLAFGGTRTYHRLACAIEDAGWEIRDCCFWCYGSGFPKSMDVSKTIDKAMERAVPQRRRRVWIVGCFGADVALPAEVLLEPDCVAGHTPPRRRAGQGFAYSLAGRDRVDAGVVGEPARCDVLNFQGSKGNNCVTDDGSCPNLNAMHGHDVNVVALDGDKLKPREAYCADGGEVASTITRQISEQSGQDNRANAVVISMAQNTRDEVRIVARRRADSGRVASRAGHEATDVCGSREGRSGR